MEIIHNEEKAKENNDMLITLNIFSNLVKTKNELEAKIIWFPCSVCWTMQKY